MRTVLLIPARYASTRYPGKPLALLTGATGVPKTLIRRSYEAAIQIRGIDVVAIATDDHRIAEEARGFDAPVIMTSPDCQNGTERCAEAASLLSPRPDIVINLQGDAPLTPPWFVEALIGAMAADPELDLATPVLRCDQRALESFVEDRRAGRVGATTAVFDAAGRALYFSKEVIPFTGRELRPGEQVPVFHHVGVYAYRITALACYPSWSVGPLERWEGLEQLRFLEQGRVVACVEVEARGTSFWELNNPEDIPRIEAALQARGAV